MKKRRKKPPLVENRAGVEIRGTPTVFWINEGGACVARLCKTSWEIYKGGKVQGVLFQAEPTEEEWQQFRREVVVALDIYIGDESRPRFILPGRRASPLRTL